MGIGVQIISADLPLVALPLLATRAELQTVSAE
jgi:hypothetical protein